jgi:carbamoyltransferase
LNVLGLTATISWNTAAAVVRDGRLVAAAEEERFNRIKQAPRMPPVQSAGYCLQSAGLTAADIDYVAVGFAAPTRYAFLRAIGTLRDLEFENFLYTFPSLGEYLIQQYKLRRDLEEAIPGITGRPWVYVRHHVAHAASALYTSGFAEANVLTIDGNGEDDSALLGVAEGGKLRVLGRKLAPESLGGLYSNATHQLGFVRHVEEGKTMGLAAYGEPVVEFAGLRVGSDSYDMDRRFLVSGFWEGLGAPRRAGEEINDGDRDFAASIQNALEEAGMALARGLHQTTGKRALCLAGGVVLNCDMNAKILGLDCVDEVFIQPAAHDAGTALGAALEVAGRHGDPTDFVMEHAYWGPEYRNEEIQAFLDEAKVAYTRPPDIEQAVAERLAAGDIVGWFQGRMEIGPRALGGRSILANPAMPEMKDKVNAEVKHREGWRPFAPSMLEEEAPNLVFDSHPSPFMLLTFTVKPEWREGLSAAMHVDDTVRSQTVSRKTNPRYHGMISKFQSLTGVPAVLNTSFNDRGEPIVMSPQDAVRCFYSTGLDQLAIGDFLVSKNRHGTS